MLRVENLSSGYGELKVLHEVSFHVKPTEFVSLIGSNGAGKTTLLRTISGFVHNSAGEIHFQDRRIDNIPQNEIVQRGLVQVPEGRQLFTDMTVLENLELGAYTYEARRIKKANLDFCYELFPILKERKAQIVGTMSGGQQQMVAIARGLMSAPKLLILDEPSIGLSPLLTKEVFETIKTIKSHGVTVLLVEQNAKEAVALSDRSYVMENGRIVLEGSRDELLNSEKIKSAYLGH